MNNGLLNKCEIQRTAKYSYAVNMATRRDDDEYGESISKHNVPNGGEHK